MSAASVDAFMDDLVGELRRRAALLADSADRRAVEDTIALLTDHRLSGMDGACFERLLAALRGGRSPVGMAVLKPEAIGAELSARWRAYAAGAAVAAGN